MKSAKVKQYGVTAIRVFGTFRSVTVTAAVMSVCSFFIGSVVSYALELPYGAAIVLTELAVFGCFCAAAGIKRAVRRKRK